MKLRGLIAGATLAIAFVINPACYETFTQPEPVFTFAEPDMRAAVEGTWELKYLATSEIIRFTVRESAKPLMTLAPRGGLIAPAHACSNRSFVRLAAACEDVSEMPLELIADGHHFEKAELCIIGTRWDGQEPEMEQFKFTIDGIRMGTSVSHAGASNQWERAWGAEGDWNHQHHVSVSLRRIAR